MKTVILIGAQGKMGKAAASGLKKHRVVTASRSGEGCDYKVDITDKKSISDLFKQVGEFDAVVNTVGFCEYANFADMTDEQWDVWCNALPLEEFCAYIGHDWKAENMDALIVRFSIGSGSTPAVADTGNDFKAAPSAGGNTNG